MPRTASEQERPSAYDIGDTEFDTELDSPPQAAAHPAGAGRTPPPATPADQPRPVDTPKHSALSASFAKDFGFTEAEIAELTPNELDAAVRLAHRQWLQSSKELSRNQLKGEGAKPAEGSVAKPAEGAKPAEEEEDPFKELEDEFDPKLVKVLRDTRKKDKDTIGALQKKLEDYEGRERAAAMEKVLDEVDRAFGDMPKAVKVMIGEGDRRAIKRGSAQHMIRKAILEAAEQNQADLPFAEKMRQAAFELVPGAAAEPSSESLLSAGYSDAGDEDDEDEAPPPPAKRTPPPKDPANGKFTKLPKDKREEAWKGAGTARPTDREDPQPKGEKKALQTARNFMLKAGLLNEEDLPDDAFPA